MQTPDCKICSDGAFRQVLALTASKRVGEVSDEKRRAFLVRLQHADILTSKYHEFDYILVVNAYITPQVVYYCFALFHMSGKALNVDTVQRASEGSIGTICPEVSSGFMHQ